MKTKTRNSGDTSYPLLEQRGRRGATFLLVGPTREIRNQPELNAANDNVPVKNTSAVTSARACDPGEGEHIKFMNTIVLGF